MKVSFKSNFSFKKLADNFKAVVKDSNLDISTAIAKNTKKNIIDGLSPALEESTLIQRQEGRSSWKKEGHNEAGTESFNTKPLWYTGRLKDSIEGSKDGLKIYDYGLEHQKGFMGSHGDVPARPFIATLEDDKAYQEKIQNNLVDRMNKAMKK